MSRKFIAAVVAASVAITGISSVPAQAGSRDLERLLVGATVLAIIGVAISDSQKRQQAATRNTYDPYYDRRPNQHPHVHSNNSYNHTHNNNNNHVHQQITPRPLPQQVQRNLLPAQCERTVQTRKGPHRVFLAHCLNDNYRYSRSLPANCSTQVRKDNGRPGTWNAFGAACLRGLGYRTARR